MRLRRPRKTRNSPTKHLAITLGVVMLGVVILGAVLFSAPVAPRAGSFISRKQFGHAKVHVAFRTLGGPNNSGAYVQDRYEANINEVFGWTVTRAPGSITPRHPRRALASARHGRRSNGRRSISIFTRRNSMPPE